MFSGLLYIKDWFLKALKSEYRLTVTASDTVHTREVPVLINVTTLNRNAPEFTSSDLYIPEDILEHSSVHFTVPFFRVEASDVDEGICAKVKFTLVGDSAKTAYRIDEDSGEMFLRKELDREDLNLERVVRVMASDWMGRHSFVRVHITVKDINDQVPTFEMDSYHALLYEPVPVGYSVLKVSHVSLEC